MQRFQHLLSAVALASLACSAQAVTVTATDLAPFEYSTSATVNNVRFDAINGHLEHKEIGSIWAMGVTGKTGPTGGEIDLGEAIHVSFLEGLQTITSFSVAFLFDGPEFNDVNERAQVSFGGTTGTLIATGATSAVWSLSDGTVQNISPATVNEAGAWTVFNPFGNLTGDFMAFTAVPGFPGTGCPGCSNQSDYSLLSVSSVTAVPEPSTYALMAGGLLAVASVVRRRSGSNAS